MLDYLIRKALYPLINTGQAGRPVGSADHTQKRCQPRQPATGFDVTRQWIPRDGIQAGEDIEGGGELGEGGEGDKPPQHGPAVEEQNGPAVIRRRVALIGVVLVARDVEGSNAREDAQAEAIVAVPQRDRGDSENQHEEGDKKLGDADREGPWRDRNEGVGGHGSWMGLGLGLGLGYRRQ
jgi:hypothetical protein